MSFPPSLWAAPLNDKHAWHNATIAYMYGPLVLAGVGVKSDLFMPAGGAARDAASGRRGGRGWFYSSIWAEPS